MRAGLEQTNRDLIDTMQNVLRIQQEGRVKRAEIETRMAEMTDELKRALVANNGTAG